MRSNTEASYHYEYKYKKTCEKSSEKVLFVIVIERSNKRVFFPVMKWMDWMSKGRTYYSDWSFRETF